MLDFFAELEKAAKRRAGSLAFASPGGVFNYDRVVKAVENVASNALANDLRSGAMVRLDCAEPGAKFLLFLGLLKAGLDVGTLSSPAAYADHGVAPDAVLSDRPAKMHTRPATERMLSISARWFQPIRGNARPRDDNADYALVLGSSGSTGAPKLIRLGRANLAYHVATRFDDPYFGGDLRYLSTAGTLSLTTLADYMTILMRGGLVIQTNDRSARAVLDALDLYRPSCVSMAPRRLVEVLRMLNSLPRRISRISYLRLTGAYCAPETCEEALVRCAEHVITSYGATEIGRIAWGDVRDIAAADGSVGRIIKDVHVEAVDPNGHPLPRGAEGELRIKPPLVAVARYLTGSGRADVLHDGWFYPGDLGRVDNSGQLIFTGRKSTVLNLGGNKISPEVLEATLLQMPGVDDVAAAPVPTPYGYDAVCALVVSNSGATLEDIRSFLQEKRARFSVAALKSVAAIPRTEAGKIDRQAVKEIAESR